MKKNVSWVLACVSALLLASCSVQSGGSSEPAAESPSQSSEDSSSGLSSSEETQRGWGEEIKSLMATYCGEVLPFPNELSEEELSFKECTNESGAKFLQIVINSPSFLLQYFYEDLEEDGWGCIKGFEDNEIRQDDYGTQFCELTKVSEDKSKGYNVSYFFNRGTVDASGTTSGAYNCIWCYNNATPSLTEDTAWKEEDGALLEYVLMGELPFWKMGSDYVAYQRSADEVILYDYSAIDCRDYAYDALLADGYDLNEKKSVSADHHVLTKKLEDGSTITAELLYSSGNLFQFTYSAKAKNCVGWPSEAFSPVEEATGVKIPQFAAKNNRYAYYSKRGLTYVYAYTDGDVSDDYEDALHELGLTDDYLGTFTNWEENLYLYCSSLVDEDYSIVGFEIVVGVVKSSSSFSSAWPSEAIESFCEEVSIGVSCPAPEASPTGGKDIRYTVETDYEYWAEYWYEYLKENADWMEIDSSDEEALRRTASITAKEQIGVFMDVYDPDNSFASSYAEQLFDLAWHREKLSKSTYGETSYQNLLYEDPTGEIAIYIYRTGENVSRISVMQGSKEAHSPSFSFAEESLVLGLGTSTSLEMDIDMLPYEVNYSCDDTSGEVSVDAEGKVTIAEDAEVGKKVTVTAKMDVPGESEPRVSTIEITIAEKTPYTVGSAYDAAAELMNNYLKLSGESKIRRNYYDEDETIGYFEMNFGERSVASVQKAIEKRLIPDGFALESTWTDTTSIWKHSCSSIRYKCDGIIIEYQVYSSDGVVLVIFLCYKEGTTVEPSDY